MNRNNWIQKYLLLLIFLIFVNTPYMIGLYFQDANHIFSGFLFNPLDGNSYLAKMYQGWQGDWKFSLPYTAQISKGVFLFPFYIFLGHIARITNLSILSTFHYARLITSIIMVMAIYNFFSTKFLNKKWVIYGTMIAIFGSGLGWFAILFGWFSPDFWISEIYPFLSAYANPHFPLSIAIMVIILTSQKSDQSDLHLWDRIKTSLYAFILSAISPFSVVVVALVLFTNSFVDGLLEKETSAWWIRINHKLMQSKFPSIIIGGFPYCLYQVVIVQSDPILRGWNNQNVTQTPGIPDLVIAFMPILIAIAFKYILGKNVEKTHFDNMSIWVVLAIILIHIPISLQRRFLIGVFVPFVGIATSSLEIAYLEKWPKFEGKNYLPLGLILFFFISIMTNIVILSAGVSAVIRHDPSIYISSKEVGAFNWLEDNTDVDVVILSSPETGLLIPAKTGRRVVYGHPYETVDAENNEKAVIEFFSSRMTEQEQIEFLNAWFVEYIFWGPREQQISPEFPQLSKLIEKKVEFRNDTIIIYRINLK